MEICVIALCEQWEFVLLCIQGKERSEQWTRRFCGNRQRRLVAVSTNEHQVGKESSDSSIT